MERSALIERRFVMKHLDTGYKYSPHTFAQRSRDEHTWMVDHGASFRSSFAKKPVPGEVPEILMYQRGGRLTRAQRHAFLKKISAPEAGPNIEYGTELLWDIAFNPLLMAILTEDAPLVQAILKPQFGEAHDWKYSVTTAWISRKQNSIELPPL